MPITNTMHEGKYIALYEEENFRAFVRMAEYQSVLDHNNNYDIVTDIKIIDTVKKEVVYTKNNIFMAYDKEGIVSISNYIEKIIFYLIHEVSTDMFWKRLFIDKVFEGQTLKLEIYCKRVTRQIKEEQEQKRVDEYRQVIDNLKEEIRAEYNKKGIAVFYNISNIYFIDDVRVIPSQQNNYEWTKRIENDMESYRPYILKHVELDWLESDLQILKELLKTA